MKPPLGRPSPIALTTSATSFHGQCNFETTTSPADRYIYIYTHINMIYIYIHVSLHEVFPLVMDFEAFHKIRGEILWLTLRGDTAHPGAQ